MHSVSNPLELMTARLSRHAVLDDDDRAALASLPVVVRTLDPSTYIVREGEPPRQCGVLVSGYAFRQKLTRDGTRQIVSLEMPGDILDLPHLFVDVADHNVQMLTRATVAFIPRPALRDLTIERPRVGVAINIVAAVGASMCREWVLNIGRRDARSRVAHLLCEFSARLDAIGLADGEGYDLPMTQEQLGDALGLTSVHVNRTLKNLEEEGLIMRNRRFVSFPRSDELRYVADFNARYLHLEQQQSCAPALERPVMTLPQH